MATAVTGLSALNSKPFPSRICAGVCEELIPTARLRRFPNAQYCARCQERLGLDVSPVREAGLHQQQYAGGRSVRIQNQDDEFAPRRKSAVSTRTWKEVQTEEEA